MAPVITAIFDAVTNTIGYIVADPATRALYRSLERLPSLPPENDGHVYLKLPVNRF